MRYSLIIFLACLPILALTAVSFAELAAGTSLDPPPLKKLDLSTAEQQAQEARAQAESLKPLAQSLAESDLLDTRHTELPAVTGGPTAMTEVWARSEQARELIVQYRPLGKAVAGYLESRQAPAADDQQRANDTLKSLKDFYAKTTRTGGQADGLQGARAFLDLLKTYEASLDRDSQGYVLKKALDAQLERAERALKVGSYKECHDALEPCRAALAKYLAALEASPQAGVSIPQAKARVEGQIEAMAQRAEFGVERAKLKPARASDADESLLTQYTDFLRRFPKPPTAAEAQAHDDVRQELGKLKVILAVAKLAQHDRLGPLLKDAALIVETPDAKAEDKRLARDAVANWLRNKGLPEKKPPDEFRGLQEITLQSGLRRIGIFHLPQGAEQYRYWKDVKRGTARSPAAGDEQYSKSNVVEGPAKLTYVAWADEYNEAVRKLTRGGATKADWARFAELCSDLQKKLAEYRNRPGIGVTDEPDRSFKEWEFEAPAEVARELLADWELFQKVMAR